MDNMRPARLSYQALALAALLVAAPAGCSNSQVELNEPVIRDLVITPNPARRGSVVTVTVHYFSPVQAPAAGLWSELFALDPTDPNVQARLIVTDDCWDCVITTRFVLGQARGIGAVDVVARDVEGRVSNSITREYTSLR